MPDSIPVLILAGGLGTRLNPIFPDQPKSLAPVLGQPFISYQLRLLREQGVKKVILCVGHLGEKIRDFVGDGKSFGLEVDYSFDGPKLRGTGGAICQAMAKAGDCFGVIYGDSYLEFPLLEVERQFVERGSEALMTIFKNEGRFVPSNILFDGSKILEYNKANPTSEMKYIEYGFSLYTAKCFTSWENAASFDLGDLVVDLIKRHSLSCFEVSNRFYEIGTAQGIAELEEHLSGQKKFAANQKASQ